MLALRTWSVRHARLVETVYSAFSQVIKLFTPIFRRIPQPILESPVKVVERWAKGLMFDCQMCGQCVLSETGMSCPMNCPKSLRNGPCGGVFADGGCEVKPEIRCVWINAWDGADQMQNGDTIKDIRRPLRQRMAGKSTWVPIMRGEGGRPPWLEGDDHDFSVATPELSRLQELLQAGEFAVTCEYNPPNTVITQDIVSKAAALVEACDAVNVTDCAGAYVHISSLATCAILTREGAEPVMQMTCRDRNLLAVQADIMGAAALGIKNILCMTGDGVEGGDHPDGKPVFDLDSSSLIRTVKHMRDEKSFVTGKDLISAPELFIGGTANPMAPLTEIEINRMIKKAAAGAQFFQTQFCFDMERFENFMNAYRATGLHQTHHLIIGIGPLNSARAARWMRDNIPGVRVPRAIIDRMESVTDQKAEGREICIEAIKQLKQIDGVSGVHIMAIAQESAIPEIVKRAKIGPQFRS